MNLKTLLTPLAINFGLSAATSAALILIVGVSSGPTMVGLLGLWMGYAIIFSQFISFGMQNGIYEVCRDDSNLTYLFTKISIVLSIIISMILWIPLHFVSEWLYDFHSLNINVLLIYTFAISVQKILRSSFTIIGSFNDFHYISIFKSTATAFLGGGIFFGLIEIEDLFFALTLMEILTSIVMLAFLLRKEKFYFQFGIRKSLVLLKSSYLGFISNSIYEINSKVDIVICSILLTPLHLGIYTTAVTVFEGFIALCTLRKSETYMDFLEATKKNDVRFIDLKVKSELLFLLKWLLPCFVLGLVYIFVTIGELSLITAFMLGLMLIAANLLGGVLGLQNIYYTFGKQDVFSRIMLSALIVNILGSIFLVKFIGMFGIGLSTAIVTVYVAFQMRRSIGVVNERL